MAGKRKDLAVKEKEPQVRGGTGPPSATRNERAQGRKGRGGDAHALPKVGKHDAGGGRSRGDGLH